jgi:hypothetical protein
MNRLKFNLIVIALLAFYYKTSAQDECSSATTITPGTSCSYTTFDLPGTLSRSANIPSACVGSDIVDDAWAKFTATNTSTIVRYQNSNRDAAIWIYSGTCTSLTYISCANNITNSGIEEVTFTTVVGTTYFIRVGRMSGNGSQSMSGSICVMCGDPPANDDQCGATLVAANSSCSYTSYTNVLATPSSGLTAPSCGNYSGGDIWFKTVVPSSGALTITTDTGTIADGAMAVYSGTCGSLTLINCFDGGGGSSGLMPAANLTCLTPGDTILIRFWESGNDVLGTFKICVVNPGGSFGVPTNDEPCNATSIILGVPTTGTNSCSGGSGEPSAPSCWTNGSGQLNTVWYSAVAPASGKLSIRTGLGTLINTQIQAFSGSCSSLVSLGCSDDVTLCGGTQQWSQLLLTGLTAGATYYIRVDGYNGLMGDFTVTAIDGNTNWPAVPGQDCSSSLTVCSANMSVGNPGFLGSGNFCDYPGNANGCSTGSCIKVGERNSVWYSFSTNATGNIEFTITPNSPVDYDWALYDVTGLPDGCSSISSSLLSPVRCSYWGGTGPTGLSSAGTETCDGTSGTEDGWSNMLPVSGNRQYLLFVSNYSLTTFVGYSLSFGASPINYNQSNTLTWSGSAGTNWNNSSNWGGCNIPDCSRDVLIYGGPSSQPIIPDNTTINVRNLTIQAGATLTFGENCTLNICGSYVNNGLLDMPSTCTIQFQNSGTQTIDGNMTGSNMFGNFTVAKTGGTLSILQDVDISGNLTINSALSTTTLNGKKIKLAGNFSNLSSTLVIPVNSILEFNGGNNQTYNQGTVALKQQNVIANKTGGVVTLQTDLVVDEMGVLDLTSGIISTGLNKVYLQNENSTGVTGGSSSSYIDGELLRDVDAATTIYTFPIGKIGVGFQLATADINNPVAINSLSARFNSWSTVPMGPTSNDCGGANYGLMQVFNSGYWTFSSTPANVPGVYSMTIASTGQTNAGTTAGTTIVKSTNGGTTWGLDGVCVTTSNARLAARSLMSGFGVFAIAQTSAPLPVELLSFTATPQENFNLLEWTTASEKDNDFFTLEKSFDGISFEIIGTIKGAGNSNVEQNYSMHDNDIVNGITYYRLSQTDYDGTTSKSSIIVINRKNSSCVVTAYPNPSIGPCVLNIETVNTGNYTVYISDLYGKEIFKQSIFIDKEVYSYNFNISDYKCGIYNCILENEGTKERVTIRFIRQ